MRVLLVCEPGFYGVIMYVRNLVRHLHRAHPGIAVDLAYSSRRDSPTLYELLPMIQSRGGKTIDLRIGNSPEPRDLAALFRIGALVREGRYDLVHAHSSKAGALVRMQALLPGFPPVLYSPHGYYGMSLRGGRKEKIFNAIEAVFGRIGKTHNVSKLERRFALRTLRLNRHSLIFIGTGIDLGTFTPVVAGQKFAARCALGLPESGKLLVTLGREAYEKNFAPLYAALNDLLPGSSWNFAHAGVGSDAWRASLSPAAQAKVFTYPFLTRPEELLHAADGFVLTSRTEAFGLAAYEALCCNLPLVLASTMGLLSLKKLNLPGIQWLPNPAEAGDITAEIREALAQWAVAPSFDIAPRRKFIEREIDEFAQFAKLVRVYQHMIDS